jgi:hypothetical protein
VDKIWTVKFLPKGRDEWVGLLLLPLKVYVVIAPVLGHLLSLHYNGRWFSRTASDLIAIGFLPCIPLLLLGALLQAAVCKRGQSLKTLVFVGFAFLILFFHALNPSSELKALVRILSQFVVMCGSILAFMRTKLKGFVLLAAGCAGSFAVQIFMIQSWNRADRFLGGDYGAHQDFITIIGLVSIVAEVLTAVGIVLIIRNVLQIRSSNPAAMP